MIKKASVPVQSMSIETTLTLGVRKFSGNFYSNIVNGICRYMKDYLMSLCCAFTTTPVLV